MRMIDTKPDNAYGPFGSTFRMAGPKRFQEDRDARQPARDRGVASPRRTATQHELTRVELLAGLPGETLAKLGQRMERQEVAPGTVLVREGEPDDRFYVLLTGVLAVSQRDLGPRGVLRPGDYFGEVAPAMSIPRTATVSAMTPAVVASCDRATFDELLRPLFADDD
jgi:CRP-like cAMP-binding protein